MLKSVKYWFIDAKDWCVDHLEYILGGLIALLLLSLLVVFTVTQPVQYTTFWWVLAVLLVGGFLAWLNRAKIGKFVQDLKSSWKAHLGKLGTGVLRLLMFGLVILGIGISLPLILGTERHSFVVALVAAAGFVGLLILLFRVEGNNWRQRLMVLIAGAALVLMWRGEIPAMLGELAPQPSFNADAWLAVAGANQPGTGTLKYTDRIVIASDCHIKEGVNYAKIERRDNTCYVLLKVNDASLRIHSPHVMAGCKPDNTGACDSLFESKWLVLKMDPKAFAAGDVRLTAFRFAPNSAHRAQLIPPDYAKQTPWNVYYSTGVPE